MSNYELNSDTGVENIGVTGLSVETQYLNRLYYLSNEQYFANMQGLIFKYKEIVLSLD